MAIIKCKMCGGDLEISEGLTVAECEYCGTMQTIPTADSEKKLTLFARANRLLRACEFDKASGVFESIVAEFPEEAEAYWGLVLCKYGIEYVDDPATAKKVPTCHRSSFDSIMDNANFELVLEYADAVARKVYRDEAKMIEELRKGIIEVSGKEDPYDIFICYKETDENGDRTVDSVIAQDVYGALTEKGYRVFFARISLEDKLGQVYEPYIFAALHSAKIMLAFGTDYEYFNAVWVKNEWSRFLQMIAAGEKKTLIPCFKGVDAYDMPKEFARLQAQDMGKVGAVQDLLRGIEKILGKQPEGALSQPATVVQPISGPNVDSLLLRARMFLEDRDWKSADEYFDRILDMAPECAEAYLGKSLAQHNFPDLDAMIQAYIRKKDEVKTVRLNAVEIDQAREDKMISDCCVDGYLSETQLREVAVFDRGYDSCLAGLKEYYQQVENLLEKDRYLSRAIRFDKEGSFASVTNPLRTEIFSAVKKSIEEAEAHDSESIRQISLAYAEHLDQAEIKMKELCTQAENDREADYKFVMDHVDTVETVEGMAEIERRLKKLNGYKSGNALEVRYKQARNRINHAPMVNILKNQLKSLQDDLERLESSRFKTKNVKDEITVLKDQINGLKTEIKRLS